MKILKFYIPLLILLLIACEEVYYPEISNSNRILVIQARFANSARYNYIRLYTSKSFHMDSIYRGITDANIQLISKTQSYKLQHVSDGVYQFTYPLKIGHEYKLRIAYNNEVFESEWEQLTPLPSIQKFYVEPVILDSYHTNNYGNLIKVSSRHIQTSVDIPVNKNNKYFFFRTRSIVLFTFPLGSSIGYGCYSYFNPEVNYIASPALYSENSLISKFPVSSPKINFSNYINFFWAKEAGGVGWIFEIDQYGINESIYNFYTKMSEQLKAEGNLFDPMITQIDGNIKCITNPKIPILGCFELCSVQRQQYFVSRVSSTKQYYHRIEPLIEIPFEYKEGHKGDYPSFWQFEKE